MAARARARRRAATTGTAVLLAGPVIEALDAAQAHGEWIVVVDDAYRTQVFEVAHDLLTAVRMDVDDAMDDIDEDLQAHAAAEDAFLRYHRAAHDAYVALVCEAPVWAIPAPFSLAVPPPCPPHVRELEASPMGRLATRLDTAAAWPEVD